MATRHDILQRLGTEYASAWSSGDPAAVAAFFTPDGEISVNRGDALVGTKALIEMAAGFYKEFPDLDLSCDLMRCAGQHAVFVWTLEGHHSETKNHVVVRGWEEWELDDSLKVRKSSGWFDAEDYQRQIDDT
jgi:uncharacterized protein (TIGR02246 family)